MRRTFGSRPFDATLGQDSAEFFNTLARDVGFREPEPSEVRQRLEMDEKKFRYLFNDNAMATEKTAEGIRKFSADIVKLEKFIAGKL